MLNRWGLLTGGVILWKDRFLTEGMMPEEEVLKRLAEIRGNINELQKYHSEEWIMREVLASMALSKDGLYCTHCGELLSEHLITERGGACQPPARPPVTQTVTIS